MSKIEEAVQRKGIQVEKGGVFSGIKAVEQEIRLDKRDCFL